MSAYVYGHLLMPNKLSAILFLRAFVYVWLRGINSFSFIYSLVQFFILVSMNRKSRDSLIFLMEPMCLMYDGCKHIELSECVNSIVCSICERGKKIIFFLNCYHPRLNGCVTRLLKGKRQTDEYAPAYYFLCYICVTCCKFQEIWCQFKM